MTFVICGTSAAAAAPQPAVQIGSAAIAREFVDDPLQVMDLGAFRGSRCRPAASRTRGGLGDATMMTCGQFRVLQPHQGVW